MNFKALWKTPEQTEEEATVTIPLPKGFYSLH